MVAVCSLRDFDPGSLPSATTCLLEGPSVQYLDAALFQQARHYDRQPRVGMLQLDHMLEQTSNWAACFRQMDCWGQKAGLRIGRFEQDRRRPVVMSVQLVNLFLGGRAPTAQTLVAADRRPDRSHPIARAVALPIAVPIFSRSQSRSQHFDAECTQPYPPDRSFPIALIAARSRDC